MPKVVHEVDEEPEEFVQPEHKRPLPSLLRVYSRTLEYAVFMKWFFRAVIAACGLFFVVLFFLRI